MNMADQLRTGRKTVGVKQTLKAVAENRAARVFIAQDCARDIRDRVKAACDKAGVPAEISGTMEELGRVCSIKVGAAAAALLI